MYPWFAWSFAKRNSSRDPNGFIELFRRADCLFTLITERYARRGKDVPNHDGAAMIGRDTLLPALDRLEAGKTLRLSDYATTEEVGSRYFKNRLGGLGQYYLGTLQDLGLVRGEHRPWIQFTQERGEVLAKAVDEFVPADLFFRTLNEDAVTLARLDKLSNFAFSCIEESTREHEFLLNLFFNRDGKYELDGQQRKRSLGLLLSLILANAKAESGMVSANFAKNALYGQSLGDAGTWVVPESMTQTARFWQIYARNDLLSVAAQTIFFVALGVLRDADAVFLSADEFGRWISNHKELKSACQQVNRAGWSETVRQAVKSLPNMEDWNNDAHEIQLLGQLVEAYNAVEDEKTAFEAIALGIRLLASIAARSDVSPAGYDGLLPDELLSDYPINLESFDKFSSGLWQSLTLPELAGWLVSDWGISTHLRVALRKLRYNPRATFRVRPTERGLVVEPDIPPPCPYKSAFEAGRPSLARSWAGQE